MAVDLVAPGIPTQDNQSGYNPVYDRITENARDHLNQVYPYQPTMPVAFPAYVRTYGPGVGDENYNVGWHHVPVPSGIIPEAAVGRYESPDVPVSHLPFQQALYNTTLVQRQVSGSFVYQSLRAPGINEGY